MPAAHVEVEEAMELLSGGERTGYLLKSQVTDVAEFIETVDGSQRVPRWSTRRWWRADPGAAAA